MATSYRPNATWEPGGVMPTEGTLAGAISVFGNAVPGTAVQGSYTYYVPVAQTATGTAVQYQATAQHVQDYMQRYQQMQQEYVQRQQAHYNALMDMFRYGQGQAYLRTSPVEPPKALETKALTAADREELKGALPF